MKTYEEMAGSALKRIDKHNTEQKMHRKKMANVAVPTFALCITAAVGFIGLKPKLSNNQQTPIDVPNSNSLVDNQSDSVDNEVNSQYESNSNIVYNSVDNTSNVELLDNTAGEVSQQPDLSEVSVLQETSPYSERKGSEAAPNASSSIALFWWRNGLVVTGALYNAIETNPEGTFVVSASYSPTNEEFDFMYNGKTLLEWAIPAFSENATKDDMIAYKDAYHAYMDVVLPIAVEQLSEYDCKKGYTDNSIIFTVTPDELENLPLDDLKNWRFDLVTME